MKNLSTIFCKIITLVILFMCFALTEGIAQCSTTLNLSLNGGGNTVSVLPGDNITITGTYDVFNQTSCPSCIRQVILGIEGAAIDCIYDGVPSTCPNSTTGTISTLNIVAPTTPGVYNLYFNQTLQFFCDTAFYAGSAGALAGTITVTTCPSSVNLSLNGGGNTISVLPGDNINVTGDFEVANQPSCPTCIRQVILGIEGAAIDCLYDGIPNVCPSTTMGTISGVNFVAPTTPGVYNLYYNQTLKFFCDTAFYAGSAGTLAGTITVTTCPSSVNLSLNGGGNTISVLPGDNINVTGDFEVANQPSCPTCIRQVILGIEGAAIDCLYDGIPNVCPSTTMGTISGVNFVAPTTPGVYNLYYNQTLKFFCDTAFYAGSAGTLAGTITVTTCPSSVNLSLNGGGNTISVEPGANIDVTGDFEVANQPSCPTCIRQVILGIEGAAIDCLYDGIPNVCPSTTTGTISGVNFTAPTTPGVYNLYYNQTLEFNCDTSKYNGSAGSLVGTVTVADCGPVVNLSLNGGGNTITVEPGESIDVTGDLEVSNFNSCPTCIRQFVLGIEDKAIDCIYDGIPAVCPSSSMATISGVNFTAPTTPGVYNLYYNGTLEFNCDTSKYNGSAGSLVGTVTVADCGPVINLSFNGGGDSITVAPGDSVSVTGDYEVSNFASCPTCIRQLVLGIEEDAIDCIYDGIPAVCPSADTGSISGVSFVAPTTPGVYTLYYNQTLEFGCDTSKYTGSAGTPVGTLTVDDAMSIGREETLKGITIYPNPSENGLVNISFYQSEPGELSIKVFDLRGREVFAKMAQGRIGDQILPLNLSDLQAGLYMVQLSDGNQVSGHRLLLE